MHNLPALQLDLSLETQIVCDAGYAQAAQKGNAWVRCWESPFSVDSLKDHFAHTVKWIACSVGNDLARIDYCTGTPRMKWSNIMCNVNTKIIQKIKMIYSELFRQQTCSSILF